MAEQVANEAEVLRLISGNVATARSLSRKASMDDFREEIDSYYGEDHAIANRPSGSRRGNDDISEEDDDDDEITLNTKKTTEKMSNLDVSGKEKKGSGIDFNTRMTKEESRKKDKELDEKLKKRNEDDLFGAAAADPENTRAPRTRAAQSASKYSGDPNSDDDDEPWNRPTVPLNRVNSASASSFPVDPLADPFASPMQSDPLSEPTNAPKKASGTFPPDPLGSGMLSQTTANVIQLPVVVLSGLLSVIFVRLSFRYHIWETPLMAT